MTGDDGRWQQPAPRAGWRRRLLLGLVGVAAAGAIAIAVVPDDDDPAPPLEVEPDGDPVEAPPFGSATGLPAPVPVRGDPVHAWTGDELVVWGGWTRPGGETEPAALELRADGAALDPATGRWRELAAPPLAARAAPASAWSGERLFVWGGADGAFLPLEDGAAYDPAEDRWEPLPPAPVSGRVAAVGVWTGAEFLVLGGSVPTGTSAPDEPPARPRDGAAFDPQQGTWRTVAEAPPEVQLGTLPDRAWTGDRLLAWQGAHAVTYRPAQDRWDAVDLPPRLRAPGPTSVASLAPGRVAVLGIRPAGEPRATGIVYDLDLDEVVEVLPPGGPAWPAPFPRPVPAGDYLVTVPQEAAGREDRQRDGAAVWDVASGVWRPLPSALSRCPACAAVWTGDELLMWGPTHHRPEEGGGLRWRPPPTP